MLRLIKDSYLGAIYLLSEVQENLSLHELSSRAGSLDFSHEWLAATRFFSEQRLSATSDFIGFVM